jgi:Tol biopolymer transport system component/DNA-binding winged helix-turn-helix (wHTH) protein
MAEVSTPGPIIQFGDFEIDLRAGRLRKCGLRIRIPTQSFQVLSILLQHAGEAVTRDELRRLLWPGDVFVDFDANLNTAMARLRLALNDSAQHPRFIETLPKRGYRFLAPVSVCDTTGLAAPLRENRMTVSSDSAITPNRARRLFLAGIAASLLLLTVGMLVWRFRDRLPTGDLRPLDLTSYLGVETSPALSPDGNKVAFAWNGERQDNFDIYVKQIGLSTAPLRLTDNPSVEGGPAWSPDDRWIAFWRQQTSNVSIVLIPSLGGRERELAQIPRASALSWAPDSKWLAFSAQDSIDGPSSIWAVDVDRGERRRLTKFVPKAAGVDSFSGDASPSISPDGTALAFARHFPDVYEVFVLPLKRDLRPDGEPLRVTDRRYGAVGGIAWTADSHDIVYAAGGPGMHSLWRLSRFGRRPPVRIPYALPAAIEPSISGSRARLVYTWWQNNVNIWRLDVRRGERRMLIGSTYESRNPHYSADGRRIAFQSNRSGTEQIWTCDADGSSCVQVTSLDGPACGTPRWSPDGSSLALDARTGGPPDIYVVSADGSKVRRLTDDPASDVVPSWSHDGLWVYFSSDRSGRYEVWKVAKDGGKPIQMTRNGGFSAFESADGKELFYTKPFINSSPTGYFDQGIFRLPTHFRQGLFRMALPAGEETQILQGPVGFTFGVTSKGIYFQPNEQSIQFRDMVTGRVRSIAEIDKAAGISVSPDDAYILWTHLDRISMDLMLVEDFR